VRLVVPRNTVQTLAFVVIKSVDAGTSVVVEPEALNNEKDMSRSEVQSRAHKRTQKRLYDFRLDSITNKQQEEAENDILCMIINKGACGRSLCLHEEVTRSAVHDRRRSVLSEPIATVEPRFSHTA